jgi:hypothetical protein
VGSAILALTQNSLFSHVGDRVITATWLGILGVAALLLGLSVMVPLSPAVGLSLIVVLTAAALCSRAVRRDFRTVVAYLTRPMGLSFAVLALVVAWNSTRFVEAYDTGLYHYPLTRWLSSYGTVRGLALIHFRFGFSSSWFALAAPFDFAALQGRTASLLGGFAALLCLSHLALAVSRIFQRRADGADWFLAGGYLFIILVCFAWAFEVSLSPDVPVWILTLLVGWLMLISGRPEASGSEKIGSGLNPTVVLLVAVCTLTLKPSAAPIVVVAGLFYWFNSSLKWGTRLLHAAIVSLIAVPIFVANIASSGCPVYPNPLLCMDVPWGVGKAAAQVIAIDIEDWGRWRDTAGPSSMHAGGWIVSWISQPDKLVLISFCGVCLLGFVATRGWRANKSFLYVLGLALFGTAFLLVNAPNPRFGVGYFSLYPALLLGGVGPELARMAGRRPSDSAQFRGRTFLPYVLAGIAVLVAIEGGIREFRIERDIEASHLQMPADSAWSHRLFLPPAVASSSGDTVITKNRRLSRVWRLEVVTARSNGIDYNSPGDRDQCWGAALPCVPTPPEGGVRLRVPANGFRSGFEHDTKLGDISRR